jgi:hypothetical protein
MNRDDIIRMAREADLLVTTPISEDSVFVADLERFAALVAAAEREACATACEDDPSKAGEWPVDAPTGGYYAEIIRARGNT